jgi:pimeloyl-ACP methyl ester carboxylesterase
VLRLENGTQVTYAQAGLATGLPVVFFAGPCSNRFVVGLYDQLCTDMGLRLLCFDRPGRGATTPLQKPKDWGFDSWADDLLQIIQLLKIDSFYLVAHSLGTAYALGNYNKIKHKIRGSLRFMATWAPSNRIKY